ncbi:glycosyltransferase [Candidatus Photodesmus blepharus]|uniref:Glycosyltransferase n=1 Tax=Candidatus Photodesmus blepharonis TaxID=1179155 RepID=A0A084CPL3_9GAMM|nr:glycosyltransferase [Candidatus Photodesmus blepharus]KEY91742.1 glycosyltransferase [Candidatus Photodesmus blepharus]
MNISINSCKSGIKIVHVVQHLALGGLENLTLDLLTFAHPLNKVMIISLEGNKEEAIANWPRLEALSDQIFFIEKKTKNYLFRLSILIKIFLHLKPEIVHTHHIGPLLYAGITARLLNIPVRIHTEHDVWHFNNYKHIQLQKLALKITKPILVADAEKVKYTLKKHFLYPDIITIKNGVDCNKFCPGNNYTARKRLGFPLHKILIGSAGRLEVIKGHDLIIQAMRFLPKDVHLIIAGQGSQQKNLENLVRRLALDKRVRFIKLLTNMPSFYQSLDLFCLPSRLEGLPLSPLEAQACGVPCAITDVGASSEALCPDSGKLIKPENILDIAQALLNMLANPTKISPRNFVLKNNNIKQMVKEYELLMEEALA